MDQLVDAREQQRLATLHSFGILDTPPEERFDRMTHLAADLFSAPIALVSLVDAERQWFKSCVGLDVSETPREYAFCDHAIRAQGMVVVPDASRDPRFATNPLVTGEPHIRFYAGAPLVARDGSILGTLCIIDTRPRPDIIVTALARLRELASFVVDEIELTKALQERDAALAQLEEERALLKFVIDSVPALVAYLDVDHSYRFANRPFQMFSRIDDIEGASVREVLGEERYSVVAPKFQRACTGETVTFEMEGEANNGIAYIGEVNYVPQFGPDGAVRGVLSFTTDITKRRSAEHTMHALTNVTMDVHMPIEDKFAQGARIIGRYLGMDHGGVAQCTGGRAVYRDVLAGRDGDEVEVPLEDTLFSLVHELQMPVAIANLAATNISRSKMTHPEHIEAFLAVPLVVDGARFGAIYFGNSTPMATSFPDIDVEITRVAAELMGREISRFMAFDTLRAKEAQLRELASTDPLTRVLNRRAFLGIAHEELSRAKRHGRPLSVLAMDLDHFKDVNDTYGHPAGDAVLMHKADILRGALRGADRIGRMGGEEFAILLPEIEVHQALLVAKRLGTAFRRNPTDFEDRSIAVTASFGVAGLQGVTDTIEDMLKRADEALYDAKRTGRDRAVFGGPEQAATG